MIELKSKAIAALSHADACNWVAVCEEKQRHALRETAARILESGTNLVALAGPSCSGKTTTAHRLIDVLAHAGKQVKVLSTDDFFKDVSTYPETADGVPDFDHFDRLNSALLKKVLRNVCSGNTVELPRFDFITGVRTDHAETFTPHSDSLVILEGIHALNDRLYDDSMRYFRLALNLSQDFSLDGKPLLSPRETRLMRRIIRDEKFRNYTAEQTMRIWPNVVRGEVRFILPFFDNVDCFLPTELDYEPCIWRSDALDSLEVIPPESPHYDEAQGYIRRLLPLPELATDLVPKDSVLREFIG